MSTNGENGDLLSLIMSSWGSGGPETRKRLVTAFSQNDHFTLKVGLPRNSQYVDFACNPEGDTLLHLATRRGNEKSVKMLLRIGSDPNARNKIGRTPLHEASIIGNLKILQLLVDYGGDLRLHDAYHHTPRQMTVALTKEKKMDIAYYIEVMRFLSSCYNSYETEVMVSHRKLKDMKKAQNSRAPSAPLPEINCLGFGVFCTEKDKTSLISCIPFVRERELTMVFNRYPYINGPFTVMSTMTLDKSAVTVRRLRHAHNPTVVDILINECANMRRLRHPGLLFLMAVFNTARLDSIGLVYEHVTVGSLFLSLHTDRKIYPPKKIAYILCQVCDALMYIHKQNLVHNYISSHTIQMVDDKTAKLTNFEYMNYVNDSPSNWLILREERSLKDSTWRWASPELLQERIPSFKSDLFSLCCVIWEIYERRVPWKDYTQQQTIRCYQKGETLCLTSTGAMEVLKVQVTSGLNTNEQLRNIDLEELRMTLVKESVKTYVERGTDAMDSMLVEADNAVKHSSANVAFDSGDKPEEIRAAYDSTAVGHVQKSINGEGGEKKDSASTESGEFAIENKPNDADKNSVGDVSDNKNARNFTMIYCDCDCTTQQREIVRDEDNDTVHSDYVVKGPPLIRKKSSKTMGSVRELIKVFEGL